MAELPGMARLDDPRGYECTALGCRSHGKRFLGSNFKQRAQSHSQTPRHEKAYGGEDVLGLQLHVGVPVVEITPVQRFIVGERELRHPMRFGAEI